MSSHKIGMTLEQLDQLEKLSAEAETLLEAWSAMTSQGHEIDEAQRSGLAWLGYRVCGDLKKLRTDLTSQLPPLEGVPR